MSDNKHIGTIAHLLISGVLLSSMSGCTVLDTISGGIDESRRYCNETTETKEQYQQCMDRETRFLNPPQ